MEQQARTRENRASWTFRGFMATVFWAFLTFTFATLGSEAPDDPARQWAGLALAAISFVLLVCKTAGIRVRDLPGAMRRAWRW